MKLAFCLLNYFPFGGLQRDFMRIAKECVRRGHEVHVFTMRWEGPAEPAFQLHIVPVSGLTNHARANNFYEEINNLENRDHYDVWVGFNKMPGLDLYYAADVCYQSRIKVQKSFWYRLLPRYRTWTKLEEGVFAAGKKTGILLISPLQQQEYTDCYGTEAERFHLLPPGISRDHVAAADASEQRKEKRQMLGLSDQECMLLMVGSGYQTKGLDRAIKGLAALPTALRDRCHLYVAGQGRAESYQKLARELGVSQQLHIFGARTDVPQLMLAADLLLHPSYHENTGTAILEAMAAGLPVLTTAVCGYAHYVTDADAGMVLPARFEQAAWNAALEKMLLSSSRVEWGRNGVEFAKTNDIYSLPERAAELIEQRANQRVISG